MTDPISIHNSENHSSSIGSAMITFDARVPEDLGAKFPIVSLILWRGNVMCCDSKVWIVRTGCPCIESDRDLAWNILRNSKSYLVGSNTNILICTSSSLRICSSATATLCIISSRSFVWWGMSDLEVWGCWYWRMRRKVLLSTSLKAWDISGLRYNNH